jgi:ribosomal protein S18 acetylase RimI-like enzyme
MTNSVSTRRATVADVAAVRAVGHAAWPPTYGPLAGDAYVADGLARYWSEEAVRRSVEKNRTYVAERDGAAVGTATVGELDGAPVLWKIYVTPDDQGGGVGSALLAAVLADLPPGRLLLEYVDGNERAAGFYRRHGFRELRRDPPERPGEPGLVWMERAVDRRPDGAAK